MINLFKAIELETKSLLENKVWFVISLFIPAILVFIFSKIAYMVIPAWDGGTYYDFFIPIILPLIILFITIQKTILRIIGEKTPYGTLERDLLAIPKTAMYLGKWLVNSGLAIIQVFLIYFVIMIIAPIKITNDTTFILFTLILLAMFGTAFGLLFSALVSTKETAMQIVPYIVLTFYILNPLVIPLETLNPTFSSVVNNLPFSLAYDTINNTMFSVVFSKYINNLNILKLSLWALCSLIIGIIIFKLRKK